jgi:SAM-dependent methyltransferase
MSSGWGPWEDAAQAAWYEALCAEHTLYAEVGAALVARLELAADARVADVGAGTGVSAQAALAALGRLGRVVGVDPAARMVAAARRLVTDPRAVFEAGDATALAGHPLAPFDAITASSVIWLCADLDATLAAMRAALRPGGRLGLSIPAEYLGQSDHLLGPVATRVQAALAACRAERPPAAAPTPAPNPLGSVESLGSRLRRAGFSSVATTLFCRQSPGAEQRAWLGQPVVLGGLLGTDDPAAHRRARELLVAHIPDDLSVAQRWVILTADAA